MINPRIPQRLSIPKACFALVALATAPLLAPLTAAPSATSLEQGVSVTSPSGQVVSALSIND